MSSYVAAERTKAPKRKRQSYDPEALVLSDNQKVAFKKSFLVEAFLNSIETIDAQRRHQTRARPAYRAVSRTMKVVELLSRQVRVKRLREACSGFLEASKELIGQLNTVFGKMERGRGAPSKPERDQIAAVLSELGWTDLQIAEAIKGTSRDAVRKRRGRVARRGP
jgi:hypothetical protein